MNPTLRSSTLDRRTAFVAGLGAVGLAISATEVVSVLSHAPTSPLTALGDALINLSPDRLVITAISVLQNLSKPVLIAAIVVVALLTGGTLGLLALRSRITAVTALLAGGVIVLLALMRNPRMSTSQAAWSVSVGTGVAIITLLVFTSTSALPARETAHNTDPPVDEARRRMLQTVGLTLVAAVLTGTLGWSYWLQRGRLATTGVAFLPPPRQPLPNVPSAGMVTVPGISSFFTPNDEFYRVDVALTIPRIDLSTWQLKVTGMVDRPLTLTYEDLVALPLVEVDATLCCVSNEVGGDLVGTARWTGVPLADLLDASRFRPEATQVVGRSMDGWTAGFQTARALKSGALVAVGMNGEPLDPAHGFPARLIVPGLYGYVSATKWLEEIEMTTWEGFDCYWVQRGWGKEGRVVTQSRIDTPPWGATLQSGPVAVAGVAWAPPSGVAAVEIRIDDGPWEQAQVGVELSPYTWRQWVFVWEATPGRHFLEARAIDGVGRTQTEEVRRPEPDGATGHHGIRVEVA